MGKKIDEALPESKELLNLLLSHKQIRVIEKAIKGIKKRPSNYNIDFFWELDASIGGISGYCMQFNPTSNPFPAGIGRSLFRPLQYAASEIERNKDIYYNAKWVVLNYGLHLEAVTKYIMKKTSNITVKINAKRTTLGKSIKILEEGKVLPSNLTKPLSLLLRLYNKSKHEVNEDEERERLFSPADALIAYISARILGKELLRPYYSEILKSIEKYLGRLKGLNMNL